MEKGKSKKLKVADLFEEETFRFACSVEEREERSVAHALVIYYVDGYDLSIYIYPSHKAALSAGDRAWEEKGSPRGNLMQIEMTNSVHIGKGTQTKCNWHEPYDMSHPEN